MVIHFWRIVELNDIETLDKNYSVNKKYTPIQIAVLEGHWRKLYDEFYDLRNNKTGKYTITKNHELLKLSLTLDLLSDIENRLILLINMDNIKELEKFVIKRTTEVTNDFMKLYPKIKIGMFDSALEILSVVQSVIKSQTNVFEEKLGAKENVIEKQKQTIFDVVSIMSKYLGYNLNINTLSCSEFIGHENTINSMSKTEKTK